MNNHLCVIVVVLMTVLTRAPLRAEAPGQDLSPLRSAVGTTVVLLGTDGSEQPVRLQEVRAAALVVVPLVAEGRAGEQRTLEGAVREVPAADVLQVLSANRREVLYRAATSIPGIYLGKQVHVTTLDGVEHSGRVTRYASSSVWARVQGTDREFPLTSVVRISAADPIRNGTLLGLAFGAGGGAAVLTAMAGGGEDAALWTLLGAMFGAGVGSLAGAIGDGMVGRTVLYERRTATAALGVMPVYAMRGGGVTVRVAW